MKLTIEIIPQSLCGFSLRDKVGPVAWLHICRTSFARAGYRCEVCRAGPLAGLHCFENWEYHEATGIRELVGFSSLCSACDAVKHYGHACVTGQRRRAQSHFMRVNRCTADEMKTHINAAVEQWKRRVLRTWTHDYSLIEQIL